MTLNLQIVGLDHCELDGDTCKLTLRAGGQVQAFFKDARPGTRTPGKWYIGHPCSPRARLVPDSYALTLDRLMREVCDGGGG